MPQLSKNTAYANFAVRNGKTNITAVGSLSSSGGEHSLAPLLKLRDWRHFGQCGSVRRCRVKSARQARSLHRRLMQRCGAASSWMFIVIAGGMVFAAGYTWQLFVLLYVLLVGTGTRTTFLYV